MALKVGILGLGFMGRYHYETYAKIKGARVAAICDVDRKKLSGDWSGTTGNIGGAGAKTDLAGIDVYTRAEDMIADSAIDVIDIALPTYLHAPYAVKALEADKHVISEKPMAINSREAKRMIDAAKRAKRRLFVAHCIRFWPQYVVAREIVRSRKYGRVISACFRRFSGTPIWSWQNWLQDPKKSGLCALDLHIHDADFILYCFGKPKSVASHAAGFKKGRVDHIFTSYDYGRGRLVAAEGAWEYAGDFPFSMSFVIAMEKATLEFAPDQALTLRRPKGKAKRLKVPQGDGYGPELAHFVECITKNRPSEIAPPESAMESVKLVELEVKSALRGKTVPVKF
jgi:predicted dehydrogenase